MKYPRTPHLPQSPGGTNDDKRLKDLSHFEFSSLIVTEKLDGSNVCMERDACFARSHAQAPTHPSFDLFKAYHARMKHLIPEGLQLFGEWLYAKHSITYTALKDYFVLFGVRDLKGGNMWGSWDEVEMWAEELCVPTPPVLAEALSVGELERAIPKLAQMKSQVGGDGFEGFVVRDLEAFHDGVFDASVAKYVRADHVQTPHHWKVMQMVRNRLAVESPQ